MHEVIKGVERQRRWGRTSKGNQDEWPGEHQKAEWRQAGGCQVNLYQVLLIGPVIWSQSIILLWQEGIHWWSWPDPSQYSDGDEIPTRVSSRENGKRESGENRVWFTLLRNFAVKGKWDNCCGSRWETLQHVYMFIHWWEWSGGQGRCDNTREGERPSAVVLERQGWIHK